MTANVEDGVEVVPVSSPQAYYIYGPGVEVVPDSSPQVYYSPVGKETVCPSQGDVGLFHGASPVEEGSVDPPRKLLGLKKKTVWLFLVAFIVVIAAAVGGGVGGSLAGKHDQR